MNQHQAEKNGPFLSSDQSAITKSIAVRKTLSPTVLKPKSGLIGDGKNGPSFEAIGQSTPTECPKMAPSSEEIGQSALSRNNCSFLRGDRSISTELSRKRPLLLRQSATGEGPEMNSISSAHFEHLKTSEQLGTGFLDAKRSVSQYRDRSPN